MGPHEAERKLVQQVANELMIKFPALSLHDPDFLRSFEVVCNEQILIAYSDDSVWLKMDDDGVNLIFTPDRRKHSTLTH